MSHFGKTPSLLHNSKIDDHVLKERRKDLVIVRLTRQEYQLTIKYFDAVKYRQLNHPICLCTVNTYLCKYDPKSSRNYFDKKDCDINYTAWLCA
jgi:hypothetical protein